MYFGGLFNYSLEMVDTNALPPISILPGDFTLSTNAGIPDIDGEFDLSWTSSTGADNYSVYQHSSIITEINDDLTNIAYQTAISPFSITGLSDGTYYFILVAYNEHGTTLSNCIEVIVSKPSPLPQGIPGYNLMLLISLLGLISILIIKSQINKSIKKT
jgi:hypothetical protein